MIRDLALPRRALTFVAAVLLAFAALVPLLSRSPVNAGTITERKVTLSTSRVSAASTSFNVSFRVTQTTAIRGVVVEFCQNSPLIGASCTTASGVTASPTTGTVTFTNAGSSGDATFEVHANSQNTGRFIATDSDGATGGDGFTPVIAADFTFSITATNPSATGSFYARILTYDNATTASNYLSATPGTHLDDGGVALSTANQLTVSARVQEQLQFCVGGTTVNDATTSITTDCAAAFTGSATCNTTVVDLGVVDSASTYISPVAAATQGNTCNGAAMVRTNAVNGVIVTYFAEQNAGSGQLKVAGATCTDFFTSNTDQCFNAADANNNYSDGAQQETFTAGSENFGVTIGGVSCGSTTAYTCNFVTSGNQNLRPDAEYDGSGFTAGAANTYGTGQGFAWDAQGATLGTDVLASSAASPTKVVDDEAMILRFAATSGITTPTGTYGVTSTYIATATY